MDMKFLKIRIQAGEIIAGPKDADGKFAGITYDNRKEYDEAFARAEANNETPNIALREDQLVYPVKYGRGAKELLAGAELLDRVGLHASVLNPVSISMSGEVGRGGPEEWMIICLPEPYASDWATDPDMEICSSADCDTDMEQWRINNGVPELRYDEEVVNAIAAKMAANINQTPAQVKRDKDALDEDKPDRGIRKARRSMADVMAEKGITIIEPPER